MRTHQRSKTLTMKNKLLAIAALAAACGLPAHALTLQGTSTTPGNTLVDYSAPGLLSFDADFGDRGFVSAEYQIEADDLLAPLDFSALVRNLTVFGLDGIGLSLGAGSFSGIGTVTRFFGGAAQVLGAGTDAVEIRFDTPEFYDVEIGDVFGTSGNRNWTIDLRGLNVGDRFTITMAVPEPGTLALLAAALSLGLVARRRRG
jgi:hypothetical protein